MGKVVTATVLFIILSTVPSIGAEMEGIQYTVRPIFGSKLLSYKWAAYCVEVNNKRQRSVDVECQVITYKTTRTHGRSRNYLTTVRFKCLPNSRTRHFVYFPVSSDYGYFNRGTGLEFENVYPLYLRFNGGGGVKYVPRETNYRLFPGQFQRTSVPVCVIGDLSCTGLRPIGYAFNEAGKLLDNTLKDRLSSIEFVEVKPEHAPEYFVAYDQFMAVIVDPEEVRSMNYLQKKALRRYVFSGGNVVFTCGGETTAFKGLFFDRLLPVKPSNMSDLDVGPELEAWCGEPVKGFNLIPCRQIESRDDDNPRGLFPYEGIPLVCRANKGLGTTSYVRVDTSRPIISGWDGLGIFWMQALFQRPLPRNAVVPGHWVKGAFTENEEEMEVSPYWSIGLVIIFLLIIGPADYFLTRFTRLKGLTWPVLFLSIAAFTAGGIKLSSHLRHGMFTLGTVHVVRTSPEGDFLFGESYHVVRVPDRATVELSCTDGVIRPLEPVGGSEVKWAGGDSVISRDLVFSEKWVLESKWFKELDDPLVEFHGPGLNGNKPEGKIVNRTGGDLRNVIFLGADYNHKAEDNSTYTMGTSFSIGDISKGLEYSIPPSIDNSVLRYMVYDATPSSSPGKEAEAFGRIIALKDFIAFDRYAEGVEYVEISGDIESRVAEGGAVIMAETDLKSLVELKVGPDQWRPEKKETYILIVEIPRR